MTSNAKQTRRSELKAQQEAQARTIRTARFLTARSPFAQTWDGSRLPEDRP